MKVATDTSSEKPTLPRLAYTMEEAAQILGCSYISVHRMIKRGLLKSLPHLRHKMIPASELARFVKV